MNRARWLALTQRAGRETLEDHMVLIAKALAFSTFLAIPSGLLVALGLFTLVADPAAIDRFVAHLDGHMPPAARELLLHSLHRLDGQTGASVAVTVVGFGVAVVTTTSAMVNYMTALDIAFDRTDTRSFLRRRVVAVQMAGCLGLVVVVAGAVLVVDLGAVWSVLRWPVTVLVLLPGVATLLYLGPDVPERTWRLVRPGALVAVLVWVLATGALALYAASFDAYNKAWGSMAVVIVVLTWLWLASLALLFGAELDAEVEATGRIGDGMRGSDQ